jgi:hypothetical protein
MQRIGALVAVGLFLGLFIGCTSLQSESPEGMDSGVDMGGSMAPPTGGSTPSAGGMGAAGGSGGSGGSDAAGSGGTDGTDSGSGGSSEAGSGGGSGASGEGGEPAPEPDCTTEGELRCVGGGSPAREQCMAGAWVEAESCADTEVCNGSEDVEPGTCSSLFELCVGHADEAVCVGADMHFCNADALSVRVETCGSERLCEAGVTAGACPMCLADTFSCEGRQLRKCAASGNAWMDDMLCATPELCNATSGACTAAACLPGDKTCSGDVLQQCKADQSGYEPLPPTCGAGLCDAVGKQCDVCVPSSKICDAQNDGSRTCNTDGQGYTDAPCDPLTPHCTGNGTCVQCTTPTQCTETNQCKTATCNTGTGSCGSQNRTGSCTLTGGGGGVCSTGNCVQCTSGSNCSAGRTFCVSNVCRPCASPCPVGNTCSMASDCASGICTSGRCRPACTGSCPVGNECAVAADCASNECTSGRCAKTCGNVVLDSQMSSYTDSRDCTQIANLTINFDSAVLDPEFAQLTRVTGAVTAATSGGFHPMTGLRMPLLRSIGGALRITASNTRSISWPEITSIGDEIAAILMPQLTTFSMPKLQTIGGPVQIQMSDTMKVVDLRALTTAGDFFVVANMKNLTTARFDAIDSVQGNVALDGLYRVSWTAVKPLYDARQSGEDPLHIGCCVSPSATHQVHNCEDVNPLHPLCDP